MLIRHANTDDDDAIWAILRPTLTGGETYALPPAMTRDAALSYWRSPQHETFVAEQAGAIVGTYYLRANQQGNGDHVANCGYMTATAASGKGVARAMCEHSLDRARHRGFRAMQFNLVVSTNVRAVQLWQRCGFAIVGTLPEAFRHPRHGFVDAYVMFRAL